MEGYANMTTNMKIKYRMKMLMIDSALEVGIGIAFRAIPVPAIRGCLAVAKLGMDVKTIYDSAKMMKLAYDLL